MKDLNGREVKEGDVIGFPTGFGTTTAAVVHKVDSGLGVLADAQGKVAPAQAVAYVLVPIPVSPSGYLPVFKILKDGE